MNGGGRFLNRSIYLANGTWYRERQLLWKTNMKSCELWNSTNISDLEGHWSCLKPLWLTYLGKYITYVVRYVYTWFGKRQRTWPVVSTVLSKLKDFTRSRAVTYTVNLKVIISRKRQKIETLLQATNRKWYVACQIAQWPTILTDLQDH